MTILIRSGNLKTVKDPQISSVHSELLIVSYSSMPTSAKRIDIIIHLEHTTMRHSRNLVTTAEALQRVFLSFVDFSSNLRHPRLRSQPVTNFHQHRSIAIINGPAVRTAQSFGPKSVREGPLRDEGICSHDIRVVNPDGSIRDPEPLHQVLDAIDRKKYFVVQVSPSESLGYPVCKIFDKLEFRETERAKSKPVRNAQATTKQLELGWAIGSNDLEHRMKKMKQFLEEGRRVEVVVAAKKKGRRTSIEEAEAVLKKIRSTIDQIEGAKEWREVLGTVGASVTLYIEGKAKKPGD